MHICDLLGRVYGLLSITIEQLLLRLDHRLADRYKPENLTSLIFSSEVLSPDTSYHLLSFPSSSTFRNGFFTKPSQPTMGEDLLEALLNLMIPVSGS